MDVRLSRCRGAARPIRKKGVNAIISTQHVFLILLFFEGTEATGKFSALGGIESCIIANGVLTDVILRCIEEQLWKSGAIELDYCEKSSLIRMV